MRQPVSVISHIQHIPISTVVEFNKSFTVATMTPYLRTFEVEDSNDRLSISYICIYRMTLSRMPVGPGWPFRWSIGALGFLDNYHKIDLYNFVTIPSHLLQNALARQSVSQSYEQHDVNTGSRFLRLPHALRVQASEINLQVIASAA